MILIVSNKFAKIYVVLSVY